MEIRYIVLLLLGLSCWSVFGQNNTDLILVTCDNPVGDCTYVGDGVGVEYQCTNNGNCFCGNAQVCNCFMNEGDCNCGLSLECYCNGNTGDCCYISSTYPMVDTNYGDDWITSNGVCYDDSSNNDNGPMGVTLIVVGICLGVLLILLIIAAIIRRRRYHRILENDAVYTPAPTYGVASTAYYQPQAVNYAASYSPPVNNANNATYTNYPNYYPTAPPYPYTVTSTDRR